MASNITQNRNNQKFCHLNLIKRLDLTTSVKNIQGTEDYVITTETVSKTQTGYQRNDLVSSTHPEKKFAREKKKRKKRGKGISRFKHISFIPCRPFYILIQAAGVRCQEAVH